MIIFFVQGQRFYNLHFVELERGKTQQTFPFIHFTFISLNLKIVLKVECYCLTKPAGRVEFREWSGVAQSKSEDPQVLCDHYGSN